MATTPSTATRSGDDGTDSMTAVQKLREQADAVVERIQPQIAAVSTYVRDEPTRRISAAAGAALMGLIALVVRSSWRSPAAQRRRPAARRWRRSATPPSTSPTAPRGWRRRARADAEARRRRSAQHARKTDQGAGRSPPPATACKGRPRSTPTARDRAADATPPAATARDRRRRGRCRERARYPPRCDGRAARDHSGER